MKNYFSIFVLLFGFCASLLAQNKSFVRTLDSNSSVVLNKYLLNHDYSWLNNKLEPFDIDQEALNASVFSAINSARKKLRKKPCEYDEKLDVIAYQLALNLKHYKFKNTNTNQNRVNRYMYWISKSVGVSEGFVVAIVDVPYLMNYNIKNNFFYNQKDDETDMHLFYGNKSQLRDSSFIPEAIPLYNYKEFGNVIATQLLRGKSGRKIRSKSYSKLACWITPIEKSLTGRKIPQAKMIIVFSGKRMQEIVQK